MGVARFFGADQHRDAECSNVIVHRVKLTNKSISLSVTRILETVKVICYDKIKFKWMGGS